MLCAIHAFAFRAAVRLAFMGMPLALPVRFAFVSMPRALPVRFAFVGIAATQSRLRFGFVCLAFFLFRLYVTFDGREGFIADIMLNLAGILRRSLGIYADIGQNRGKYGVPLIDFFRDLVPARGQTQMTAVIHSNVTVFFEETDCPADARLAEPHTRRISPCNPLPFRR